LLSHYRVAGVQSHPITRELGNVAMPSAREEENEKVGARLDCMSGWRVSFDCTIAKAKVAQAFNEGSRVNELEAGVGS
jgi:hypothetical protein